MVGGALAHGAGQFAGLASALKNRWINGLNDPAASGAYADQVEQMLTPRVSAETRANLGTLSQLFDASKIPPVGIPEAALLAHAMRMAPEAAGAIAPEASTIGPAMAQKRGAIMVPASIGAPEKLEAFQNALKSGMTREQAHAATRTLPLARNHPDLIGQNFAVAQNDVLAPLDPHQALHPDVKNWLLNNADDTLHTTLGEAFPSQRMDSVIPALSRTPVAMRLQNDEGYLGGYYPGEKRIEATSDHLGGATGLEGVLGHEGTHAVQDLLGLPGGSSPTMANAALAKLLGNSARQGAIGPQEWYQRLLATALKKGSSTQYRIYRADAGEQAAEAGARLAGVPEAEQVPTFTTPFAKQPISDKEISSGSYYTRLQLLRQKALQGKYSGRELENPFDPSSDPYRFVK
jgi:hypothetical protein